MAEDVILTVEKREVLDALLMHHILATQNTWAYLREGFLEMSTVL